MMRSRYGFILGAALLCPAAARAQEAAPPRATLTLADAAARALATHPAAGRARAGAEEARAAAGEAVAARWPGLSLVGSATQHQEPMPVTPIHGFTPGLAPAFDETLYQVAATASYTLFDGGIRGARVRQARLTSEAAAAGAEDEMQSLVGQVVRAYTDLLAARQTLAANESRHAALSRERDRAAQLYQVGRGARVDLLRASAAEAAAEAARATAGAAVRVGAQELARLIGLSPEELAARLLAEPLLADTAVAPPDALLRLALEASPAVERARRREAAAAAGVSLARGAWAPEIRLLGNYIDRGSSQGDFTGEWSAAVQLSYPLFTGGARGRRVAGARSAALGAAEQRRLAELEVARRLDRALAARDDARARTVSLLAAEAGFAEVARVERLRLETGVGTQTDYLAAEADLLRARSDLAAARYGEVLAHTELARLLGRLTPAWLAAHLEAK